MYSIKYKISFTARCAKPCIVEWRCQRWWRRQPRWTMLRVRANPHFLGKRMFVKCFFFCDFRRKYVFLWKMCSRVRVYYFWVLIRVQKCKNSQKNLIFTTKVFSEKSKYFATENWRVHEKSERILSQTLLEKTANIYDVFR